MESSSVRGEKQSFFLQSLQMRSAAGRVVAGLYSFFLWPHWIRAGLVRTEYALPVRFLELDDMALLSLFSLDRFHRRSDLDLYAGGVPNHIGTRRIIVGVVIASNESRSRRCPYIAALMRGNHAYGNIHMGMCNRQHFMALAGVGHQPEGAAGAQFHVRDLHPMMDATHHQTFFAQVELECFTQIELQWHERFDVFASAGSPGAREVCDAGVATAIAIGLDLGQQRVAFVCCA